jgi:hypothetical protein
MKRPFLILISVLLLNGCVAIVDESSGTRKVKSFIVTSDETLDLLERMDKVDPSQKREIRLFKRGDED